MTLANDIERIARQESLLVFNRLDEASAWTLGSQMRDLAATKKLPLVIDIRIGSRPLFYAALPGTTPENPDWVRRKINTVMRFHKSSYRVGLEYKQKSQIFDVARGLDPLDFASAGGGFPISLIGTGVIGAVTVSGIPQRDDHGFVVEALCKHLGQPHADLGLGPETP